MIVTIDGPAGSGKSTAARALAARLGFQFLDTGAMYRAVTLACQRRGVDLSDPAAVAAAAAPLDVRWDDGRIFVDGEEVTAAIRTTDVTQGTRFVAVNVAVRKKLDDLQRRAASGRNVVTEGRDQGTVVFPHAECKIFLTADPQQRAIRRQRELANRGEPVAIDDLLAQQADRDRRDEERTVAPLRPAADAICLDTSAWTSEEVLDQLEMLVRRAAVKNPSE